VATGRAGRGGVAPRVRPFDTVNRAERPWHRPSRHETIVDRSEEEVAMHLSRSVEGSAVVIAIILILFTPMLDPMVSFVIAIVVLAGLIALAHFQLNPPHAPHH
jgi:hypothetical protein